MEPDESGSGCSSSSESEDSDSCDEYCEVEVVEDGKAELVLVPESDVGHLASYRPQTRSLFYLTELQSQWRHTTSCCAAAN